MPKVVDFPQPVGPTIAQKSPSFTVRLKSLRASVVLPAGLMNFLLTFVNSIATFFIILQLSQTLK
jgi:hypothetical protein